MASSIARGAAHPRPRPTRARRPQARSRTLRPEHGALADGPRQPL